MVEILYSQARLDCQFTRRGIFYLLCLIGFQKRSRKLIFRLSEKSQKLLLLPEISLHRITVRLQI